MKKERLNGITRIILLICGLSLLTALFLPIWRIDLDAPQYPEGLHLLIYANGLSGNVDIINGLNHYIGMKTLHSEDFIEFKILPVAIVILSLLILLTAILGRRRLLYKICILFVVFGIVSMIDFWKWEYDYGHHLSPDAAIKVPGMAYQPPLIGFKQLLNFGAYSIPAAGGWIFAGVGLVLVLCSIREFRMKKVLTLLLPVAFLSLSSCQQGPAEIKSGVDHCDFCKMTISETKFAAELVTEKGRVYKFDDLHCLVAFKEFTGKYYVADYAHPASIQPVEKMVFLESADLKGPMGGNIAAFSNKEDASAYKGKFITWKEILK